MQAIILKLDLKKAYDCISWDFLRIVLIQCGFGQSTTNWIMGCVTSTVFAILVNGEATSFLQSERGLRQGCPLSPFLFILIMEGLSILLKKSQSEGTLTGIKVSRLTKILHLLFVDDVIIMTNSKLSEWLEIRKILNLFCRASGLSINSQKSTFHHFGIQPDSLAELKELFRYEFKDLTRGFKYLGVFLKLDNYKAADWTWLIEKIERRISHWCNRLLSLGGRYILIKSVLESIPIYWLSIAHLPLSVLSNLRQLSFSFLWAGNKNIFKYHLCRWDLVSRPKIFGGWGLRNLNFFYRALATNMLWRVLTKPTSGAGY
jgi:hypothetical protein